MLSFCLTSVLWCHLWSMHRSLRINGYISTCYTPRGKWVGRSGTLAAFSTIFRYTTVWTSHFWLQIAIVQPFRETSADVHAVLVGGCSYRYFQSPTIGVSSQRASGSQHEAITTRLMRALQRGTRQMRKGPPSECGTLLPLRCYMWRWHLFTVVSPTCRHWRYCSSPISTRHPWFRWLSELRSQGAHVGNDCQ